MQFDIPNSRRTVNYKDASCWEVVMLKTAIVHALGLGSLAIGSCPVLFSPIVSVPCGFLFPLVASVLLLKFTLSLGQEKPTTADVAAPAKNLAPELTAQPLATSH
jgi:hypothetical protein